MPYDVPVEYNQEKNKQVNKPINLYVVHEYNGTDNLCLAEYKEDVVFDGVTYQKFPISMEAVTENIQAEIDTIKIKVANVNRLIQSYLETYDLREKMLSIKQVWANQLADTDNYIQYLFWIDKYSANDQTIEFECSSKFDVNEVNLPLGRYFRGVCRWRLYKGVECAYTGALLTCNRTLADCRLHNNQLRFGGFPSVPTQRTFIS